MWHHYRHVQYRPIINGIDERGREYIKKQRWSKMFVLGNRDGAKPFEYKVVNPRE